ncbi:hypothetical protein QWI29_24600 [Mycolicibacterium neoaurum]|uniref:hypothetical protein n=1 Tax=Mycolicibacterium neoaurum TaxID=1795 RepID=UPI002672A238|nr:hypothetical protein [Mycolicibacterium neoaurum]MDO3403235.1 hypothetical protein [Mycolicibacterium neoaurum]
MAEFACCGAGVSGDALGRVHSGGVAETDVFPDVIAFKDDPGLVVEAFGGNTIRLCIDCGDSPTVSVTH